MKLEETHARGTMFVGAASIWKAFPANSKPPALSCANSHANSTPVQSCATCLCWPKNKAKENGHCQKNVAKALDDYLLFGKGGLFGRPFFKTNPQELSTLCIYPENSWTTQGMRQSTKHCQSQLLPNTFILQLRRNIPLTTMTSIVFCFGKRALARNASMFILWTWGRMLLKGIFLTNFWNLYKLPWHHVKLFVFHVQRCQSAGTWGTWHPGFGLKEHHLQGQSIDGWEAAKC